MREIVCIGTEEEVTSFLALCRVMIESFLARIDLPVECAAAADAFFDAARDPKFLAQKVAPLKTELLFDGRVALGSLNFHRDYFGTAYAITLGGRPAFSGCVAFGIERWLLAILTHFGLKLENWPALRDSHYGGYA